jgi:hypothetical protein
MAEESRSHAEQAPVISFASLSLPPKQARACGASRLSPLARSEHLGGRGPWRSLVAHWRSGETRVWSDGRAVAMSGARG